MQQRLEEVFNHGLVGLSGVSLRNQPRGLVESHHHLSDQPWEALEHVPQRQHTHIEDGALQLGH